MNHISRRNFVKTSTVASIGLSLPLSPLTPQPPMDTPLFKISLAEWSLNRSLFKKNLDHLDFAIKAKKHGITAVEYVNQFFMDKAQDKNYLKEMKTRAEGEGVKSLLIMCDREGMLGDEDEKKRIETVENHKKWVEAANFLGCHSIRVNGYSSIKWSDSAEAFEESQKLVADGWRRLCEFANVYDIDIMIENHGGFTSNGQWLLETIKKTGHHRAGTLPDFGNFRIARGEGNTAVSYDAYQGVKELMPFAKGVSVKTTAWDDAGNQSALDYAKMMKIVLDAGYRGYCGIEHGEAGREWESVVEVRDKLIESRDALAAGYE